MSNHTASLDRYQSMVYNRSGNSGLMLSALTLGLWHNFGDGDCQETAATMLRHAFDNGIMHFDLANNYGSPPGSAERNFGTILNRDLKPYRDELIISTKAGYLMWDGPFGEWGSRKSMLASLDQSLDRMGLDYVDIFYHHRPDPDTPLEESMGALDYAVRSGKAIYAGISNYPGPQAARAFQILKEMGTPCVIHQNRYSMLDRHFETNLAPTLLEEQVGCIAFSPLAQGQLTDHYLQGIPKDSRAGNDSVFLNEQKVNENIDTVRALNELAQERGQSLAEMALTWVMNHPAITSALIGASSVAQLDTNLKAINSPNFSDEELKRIDAITA